MPAHPPTRAAAAPPAPANMSAATAASAAIAGKSLPAPISPSSDRYGHAVPPPLPRAAGFCTRGGHLHEADAIRGSIVCVCVCVCVCVLPCLLQRERQ
jgi:hypothetical protein